MPAAAAGWGPPPVFSTLVIEAEHPPIAGESFVIIIHSLEPVGHLSVVVEINGVVQSGARCVRQEDGSWKVTVDLPAAATDGVVSVCATAGGVPTSESWKLGSGN